MPTISHSEVETYLTCRRKHHYSYTQSLQPAVVSTALSYGSAGHAVLEAFYSTVLKAGTTSTAQKKAVPAALEAAHARFDELVEEGWEQPDNRQPLVEVLFNPEYGYFANEAYVKNGHVIVGVEEEFLLQYDDEREYRFPFVVDLIVKLKGGQLIIVDHKFVYEFYNHTTVRHMTQLPKYIAGMRALNHKVAYGQYNMLRTRKIKAPKIEQTLSDIDVKPSNQRVKETFTNQVNVAYDIQELKTKTEEEQDALAFRVGNTQICKYCDFGDLCATEMEGGNVALLLKTDYKTRERREFDELSEDAE